MTVVDAPGACRTARAGTSLRCLLLASFLIGATTPQALRAAAEPSNFSFLHISDVHIGPMPETGPGDEGARSVETIHWICEQAGKPQRQDPYGVTAPPPAFVIATGDLTEFGVIGSTWPFLEKLFEPLPGRLYVVPGNHDNTWTAMLWIMRRRHGGDSYSFDHGGFHFVGLNTASPQEPLPCLDRRTLEWLRADLKRVSPRTPLILFMHHPLYTNEFASPYEQLRLLDVLEGRRVSVILDGHGHNVSAGQWEGIDRVMGGSTFGPNAGYGVVSVLGGTLRITYRFREGKPMKASLEKPALGPPLPDVDIVLPGRGTLPAGAANDALFQVRTPKDVQAVSLDVDGTDERKGRLTRNGQGYTARLDIRGLLPGRHFVRVEFRPAAGPPFHRAAAFTLAPSSGRFARCEHGAGFKAGPLLLNNLVIVADTAGTVTGLDRSFRRRWSMKTGGEVLCTPAVDGDRILFGSGDGFVYGVSADDGSRIWQYDAKAPVYARPAVHDGIAYAGDIEGFVHAIETRNGRPVWRRKVATFTIESEGAIVGDGFCVGAWDGYVYMLDRRNGSVRWKQPCPMGQFQGTVNRYYAAADCPPVFLGGRIFVTDRSYRLGMYEPEGRYLRQLRENVSAIGPSEDGHSVYARTLDDRLIRYDAAGSVIWDVPVPAGRFPVPPTERGGKVYVCSNRGRLTILTAADGAPVASFQVTPGLHVMGAVAADDQAVAYVTDTDGGLTAAAP